MNEVKITNITKRFGEEVALDSVSLEVPRRSITALVGPSGSGKSTLLQLINGLIRPDEGGITLYGEPIDYDNLIALRRSIGYAVQGTGLFPHMTIRKNVILMAKLEGWKRARIQERLHGLMELVNLPLSYLDRYPYELSGGEQQRVGLCRAMMLNPRLFLLDEAFGALDPITRGEIHEEFLRIQSLEPRTILMVTHDIREALKLADFILLLNGGRVEQSGTGDDILRHPANDFVSSFIHRQLDRKEIEGGSP